MRQNNFFLTGGSGFIGTHFHKKYDNSKIINYDILTPFVKNESVFTQGDIRNFEQIKKAMKGCDVILHLAATHFDFQKNYFPTNKEGTSVLLKAAAANNIDRFVFYSSVAVYGRNTRKVTEIQEPVPNSEYGASKLEAEKLIRAWAEEKSQRSALIIRPTMVFGPYNFGNVFNLIKQIDSGFYMNIGKGQNIKSITFVENLIESTLILMQNMKPGLYVYNHTDEPHLTIHQTAETIAKALRKKTIRFSAKFS